jgi:hypothetical protein
LVVAATSWRPRDGELFTLKRRVQIRVSGVAVRVLGCRRPIMRAHARDIRRVGTTDEVAQPLRHRDERSVVVERLAVLNVPRVVAVAGDGRRGDDVAAVAAPINPRRDPGAVPETGGQVVQVRAAVRGTYARPARDEDVITADNVGEGLESAVVRVDIQDVEREAGA